MDGKEDIELVWDGLKLWEAVSEHGTVCAEWQFGSR